MDSGDACAVFEVEQGAWITKPCTEPNAILCKKESSKFPKGGLRGHLVNIGTFLILKR